MIPAIGLLLALNGGGGPDPMEVGPIRLGSYPAAVIARLGPIEPFVVCDAAHYSYTDGASTVTFDGSHEITISPTPSAITALPAKGAPPKAGTPVRPVSPAHAPLSHWTYMGRPVFSRPAALPGFLVLKPGRGESVHWYRPGTPRIDYYRLVDGTVEITDAPRQD